MIIYLISRIARKINRHGFYSHIKDYTLISPMIPNIPHVKIQKKFSMKIVKNGSGAAKMKGFRKTAATNVPKRNETRTSVYFKLNSSS